ncbi:hypothetical protein F5882DRAFT_411518, partial [Hyaloscypha sp. PMI_1271]
DHERIYSAFLPTPVFCPLCRARRFTLDTPCQSCQRHEKARYTPSFPLERFRSATCSVCHTRRRDEYYKGKGEPVSKEERARRFRRAQRVVEKALLGRIREEKLKGHWFKARERWEQGGLYYKEGFEEGVGYTNPREGIQGSSTGVRESLIEGS